jgi:hypothetical protein
MSQEGMWSGTTMLVAGAASEDARRRRAVRTYVKESHYASFYCHVSFLHHYRSFAKLLNNL